MNENSQLYEMQVLTLDLRRMSENRFHAKNTGLKHFSHLERALRSEIGLHPFLPGLKHFSHLD